jgi:hypothetical protein
LTQDISLLKKRKEDAIMYKKTEGYDFALSIDLRVFDNCLADYGVGDFIEKLGFIPDYLFNHETYVGQIHSHDGKIDDTLLLPTWTAQRAIPGGQWWTRRQYRALVDELHRHGIKFFQGAEAAWSVWPEYGEASRDTWIYNNMPEMFTTYRTGVTTAGEMGMICPLKRMKDGMYYEDRLLRDVLRFMDDYQMDGFFAADGFGGLGCKLYDGDYSDDIISQFTEHTGIEVKGGSVNERADYIWENLHYEWAVFYSDRWAQFYSKITKAIKAAGKELIVMAPFKHGPADSLMEYGFDYAKNVKAGLDFLALESMETSSRRWQYTQAMEAVGISNVSTIKAICPNVRILWMSSTCNCPEHWHTLRDIPNALERECLALNTARAIGPEGKLIKGFDGVQALFGIDLNADEWRWYKQRLDIGHLKVASNDGLVILWSDKILYENARRRITYPLSTQVVKLRFAGLPIHTAVDFSNIRFVKNKSLLLIQPLGICEEDVIALEELVCRQGKNLIVLGEVENSRLLKLLGISRNESRSYAWKLESQNATFTKDIPEQEGETKEMIGGYEASDAEVLINVMEGGKNVGAGLTVKKFGSGNCIYIRRLVSKLPQMRYKRSEMDLIAHPSLRGPENDLLTTKQVFESLANVHPDSYELICARCVEELDGTFPYSDKGQVLSCSDEAGNHFIFCENPLNMLYIIMTVTLPHKKKLLTELSIRFKGPIGYQYYGDLRPNKFDVCVPPEAVIPFRIEYEKD